MGSEGTDWGREASLLRPAKPTLALFQDAPVLDASRPWVPDHLLPLHGGPRFANLTPAQRLRYNHAYARQLLDEFIWTERVLILGPLRQLCRTRSLDADKSAVLTAFISDEVHHIESFSHLEDLAVAADQPAVKSVFRPPPVIRALSSIASRYPGQLTFWASLIEAFEQYALKIGQAYHRDDSVDPLFREVFLTHARDEARHCRFDVLIARWLQTSVLGNAVNARLTSAFGASYRSVDWGLDGPIRELADAYPQTARDVAALIAEAKALRRSAPLPAASE